MRQLPNLITLLRLALVLPLGWLLYRGEYAYAVVLFLLAGISDGLDGWLARRFDWMSAFGRVADPLADKLLVGCVYLVLTAQGSLPVALMALVIGRDVLIVAGAFGLQVFIGRMEFLPTRLGKLNTLVQISFVVIVLLALTPVVPIANLAAFVREPLLWLVVLTTCLSGLDYMRIWLARLRAARREGV